MWLVSSTPAIGSDGGDECGVPDAAVVGEQGGGVYVRARDDDPVGRVAMERVGQCRHLGRDGWRQIHHAHERSRLPARSSHSRSARSRRNRPRLTSVATSHRLIERHE